MTELLLELDPGTHGHLAANNTLPAAAGGMERSAGAIINDLGLPAGVSAIIRPGSKEATTAGVVGFTINGKVATCAEVAVRQAQAFARNGETAASNENEVHSWLQEAAHSGDHRRLAGFFGHLTGGVLERQPELLVTPALIDELAVILSESHAVRMSHEQRMTLARVVERSIGLGVSIREKAPIAQLLTSSEQLDASRIAEAAVVAFGPAELEIRLPSAYLRELTSFGAADIVSSARARFVDNTGVLFPPVRFLEDDGLPRDCFCFRIRGLTSQPLCGFGAGKRFVANVPSYLKSHKRSTGVLHPYDGVLGWVVPESDATWLSLYGAPLSPIEFIVECLVSFLQTRVPRLVDQEVVNDLLDGLLAFPQLVSQVRKSIPGSVITGVIRGLVANRVSVRDLADVLEALLDYLYATSPMVQLAMLGEIGTFGTRNREDESVERCTNFVHRRLRHPMIIGVNAATAEVPAS